MPDFSMLLQPGGAPTWFFAPAAILMGALHGLEPGHSKTMMAAFIIAVRGTVTQAVLLGLAATISHTAIVWILALGGLYFGSRWKSDDLEAWMQLLSAFPILFLAGWMFWRTRRDAAGHGHDHHHDAPTEIDTGEGRLSLEIHERDAPPRWRLRALEGAAPRADEALVETERPDGARQTFAFVARDGYCESVDDIPEPHAFVARLSLARDGGDARRFEVQFAEDEHHHDHHDGLDDGDMDAHQREHAEDIRRRFSSGHATTGQIVLFGLTGGLIPCPSSITILLLCLQLRQFTLGAALVLCFSLGLAVTMVSVGAAAAWSVRHASRRWSGFDAIAARAPYLSVMLMTLVALYTGWLGWRGLFPA